MADIVQMNTLGGRRVLSVIAAQAEYGPHLRARVTPLICGVGPVESAIAVTAALTRLARDGQAPDLVLSIGSAGSQGLEQGRVYQVASVSYRDMDASALGFARGVTPFADHGAEIALPLRVPGVPAARLSTGGAVISGAGYDPIDADMVDMESYAVCRACMEAGVPLIGLRGISDGAAPLGGMMDWTRYLDLVDERLAAAVDRLDAALRGGLLDG